jgi:formamidopyrimidine-DNA glycosylase
MPELPEVETARRRMERALRGKRLTEVLPHRSDTICFDGATPTEFRQALLGARVMGSGRKGKYFWLELDRRPWPVFHLGMTGNIEIRALGRDYARAWGGVKLWSSRNAPAGDASAPPRFCRLRLLTREGVEVAVTDPRRFGRIRLAQDPLREWPVAELGHDPLADDFPAARVLHSLLRARRAPIKALLLDQSLFAGVGNWIADETLYQAGIAPSRPGSDLSAAETARLRRRMLAICRKAVEVEADYERFPRGWLFRHRWGKEEGARTARGEAVVHATIGGRTTAWVPKRQR